MLVAAGTGARKFCGGKSKRIVPTLAWVEGRSDACGGVRVIVDDETAAAILAPIDEGVGVDGRADEGAIGDLFRELRFQRKSIFRAELRVSMGEDAGDADTWSWPVLAEVARDYLIETAKDLEPMAMLIEAAARLDGLAGVERTMTLMADLVELYW